MRNPAWLAGFQFKLFVRNYFTLNLWMVVCVYFCF